MLEDLDMVFNKIKSPIKIINANGSSFSNNTIDIANVRIEFLNGSTANLSANKLSNKEVHKIEFVQKDKLINIDYLNNESQILITNKDKENGNEALFYTENPNILIKDEKHSEFEHSSDLLIKQLPTTNSLEDARLTLKVVRQITDIINNKL